MSGNLLQVRRGEVPRGYSQRLRKPSDASAIPSIEGFVNERNRVFGQALSP